MPDGRLLFGDASPLMVDDDSYRIAELMGDDTLVLRFSRSEDVTVPLRSYCDFGGRRYYLFKSPEITKQHNRYFEYVMPMYTADYLLKITLIRNSIDGRLKFPLTATAREHLEMIVACLNNVDAAWEVDYGKTIGMVADADGAFVGPDGRRYTDVGGQKLVSYENVTCIDAVKSVALAYDTEYETVDTVRDGTIHHALSLHCVEYNKATPLTMRYGKGNGFRSGIVRRNGSDTPPIDRLYVQGGEQNIPAHYGQTWNETSQSYDGDRSETLLLPKNIAVFYNGGNEFYFSVDPTIQTDGSGNRYVKKKDIVDIHTGGIIPEVLYDSNGNHVDILLMIGMPCFLTSSDGRSLERVRHTYYDPGYTPRGTKVEAFYDASEVYPMRVGGVSAVRVIPKTHTNDDGTTETYKLYDIYDAGADCPDYTECYIAGETMTIIFQDGMLAGRELELNTWESGVNKDKPVCVQETVYDEANNALSARRLELCPSDQDGYTMPNDTFAPRVGDHYIIFHCELPSEYVSGIAYGAEYRALREAVAHLYDNGRDTYTFSGSVDGIWAKRVWNTPVEQYNTDAYGHLNILHGSYFAIGQHIKVVDMQLFEASGLVMRVTGMKQYVCNPHAPELTLTNTVSKKYDWVQQLSQTVRDVRLRPPHVRPLGPLFPRVTSTARRLILTDKDTASLRGISVVPRDVFEPFTTRVVNINTRLTSVLNDDNSIRAESIGNGIITAEKLDGNVLKPVNDSINALNVKIDNLDGTVINLDRIAPAEKPYTKDEAVSHVANVVRPEKKQNAVIVFNDGSDVRFYTFTSMDELNFGNPDYWREVNGEISGNTKYYSTYNAFPAIGVPDAAYIDKETGRTYYWDNDKLIYVRIGLDKEDLKFINANF